jgi:hypothetical protein
MDYFPNNTLASFTTRLPEMLDLDGSWEIGLAEIQYPHSSTAQQCRPQSTVLRFDRQVVNADYDNRVQDEYLTQKYDLRSRYRQAYVQERIFTQLD